MLQSIHIVPDSKQWESSGLLKTEWWGSFHSQGAHSEKPTQIEFCTTPVATNELTRPVQHIPSTTKRLKAQSKMQFKCLQRRKWIAGYSFLSAFFTKPARFLSTFRGEKKQGNPWGKKTQKHQVLPTSSRCSEISKCCQVSASQFPDGKSEPKGPKYLR